MKRELRLSARLPDAGTAMRRASGNNTKNSYRNPLGPKINGSLAGPCGASQEGFGRVNLPHFTFFGRLWEALGGLIYCILNVWKALGGSIYCLLYVWRALGGSNRRILFLSRGSGGLRIESNLTPWVGLVEKDLISSTRAVLRCV